VGECRRTQRPKSAADSTVKLRLALIPDYGDVPAGLRSLSEPTSCSVTATTPGAGSSITSIGVVSIGFAVSIGCGGRFLAAGLFAFTAVRLTSSR
jgi:hypothetical protein